MAEEVVQAITSMIARSEKAQAKFLPGTAQYSLQKNRIKALQVAAALVKGEGTEAFSKDEMKKSLAPLVSLISKSEKAQTKLQEGSWQYRMLEDNLQALRKALPLLQEALIGYQP